MAKRKNHGKEFKAKVALAAFKGDKTLTELSSLFEVHSNMITRWKNHAKKELPSVFANKADKDHDKDRLIEELYRNIGKITSEHEWLKKSSIT